MRLIANVAAALLLAAAPAAAHRSQHFYAGEPRNAKQPVRTIKVSIQQ